MPDDDDRPRDASGAAGAGWSDPDRLNTAWFEVRAPDDISELTRDVQAYHREVRAARRRALVDRFAARRGARPLRMALIVLALAAGVVAMLIVVRPRAAPSGPTQLPLSTSTTPAGRPGGVLPAVSLRRATDRSSVGSQSLRPGVLALLPGHCGCTALLTGLARELSSTQVALYAVAPSDPDAEAAALAGPLRSDWVYYDPQGSLAAAVGARQLTLVTIDRDGTIFTVQRDVTAGPHGELAAVVRKMLHPGASG